MWEDKANLYNKLEDDTQMLRSLKASFFIRGGGNVTALAATYAIATIRVLYRSYISFRLRLRYIT
jgi:ActR/RegA family two-component response regulator